MELLDRYLQAVKKHLPWKRQDDILAELRANLESQLEDKEAELGRPLTAGEAEDWLRQIGPPIQMAARYQSQQHLIGPGLFPTYWYVLRTALLWCLIVYSIVRTILIFTGESAPGAGVILAVLNLPGVLLTTVAWITLIFVAIEFAAAHYGAKWPTVPGSNANWTPSTLPPLDKNAASGKKQRSYAQALAEVIFGFLLIVWLLLIPKYPFLLLGPGVFYMQVSPYQLAPVWMQFFWWIVALNLLQSAWRLVDLLRGSWQQPHPAQQISFKALGLVPLVVLLGNQALVTLKHPALDQQRHAATLDTINRSIHRGLLGVCAIAVLQLAWEIARRAMDSYRMHAATMR